MIVAVCRQPYTAKTSSDFIGIFLFNFEIAASNHFWGAKELRL
jgi:hypothetical protein